MRVFRSLHFLILGLVFSAATITLVSLTFAPAVRSQSIVTGGLAGVVTDPTGAVVSGASFHARPVETRPVLTVGNQGGLQNNDQERDRRIGDDRVRQRRSGNRRLQDDDRGDGRNGC